MFKLNIIFVYLYMYTLYILCADLEEFSVGGGGSEGYLCMWGGGPIFGNFYWI